MNSWDLSLFSLQPILRNMEGKVRGQCHSSPLRFATVRYHGEKVRKFIIDQVKETKYFSLTVDSTPDISHIDRLACVLLHVFEDGPVERFIQFLEMKGILRKSFSIACMSGFFERTTRTFEQLLSPFRTTRMKNQQQNRTSWKTASCWNSAKLFLNDSTRRP